MIIPKWNFKTGACLWIPVLKLRLGVSLLGHVYFEIFFLIRDVEKVIQSNLVSYVFKWFIYMWYNPLGGDVTCKYILYNEIRNLAGGEFRISFLSIPPFLGEWFMVDTFLLSIYFFKIYFPFSFSITNTIYPVREHFAVLIFIKYLVLEF